MITESVWKQGKQTTKSLEYRQFIETGEMTESLEYMESVWKLEKECNPLKCLETGETKKFP